EPELLKRLGDSDSAVRYWAAMGLLIRKQPDALRKAASDSSPYVRIVAAEALGRYGSEEDLNKALEVLGDLMPQDRHGAYVSLAALNAIDSLGRKALPLKDALAKIKLQDEAKAKRGEGYGANVVKKILRDLA